jgi:hypothetical protein
VSSRFGGQEDWIDIQRGATESVASVLNEIRLQVELFESGLPTRLDAMAVSPISKLPYKALLYRETLIWRMTELSGDALESFEKNNLVSAIILTRAAIETSAALHYLCAKVETVVESGVIGDIDDYLMKLTMGTATGGNETDFNASDPVLPRPIKVSAFIKQMDKDIEGSATIMEFSANTRTPTGRVRHFTPSTILRIDPRHLVKISAVKEPRT